MRELRDSEERYRVLFDNAEMLASVYDRDGVCLMMNKGVAAAMGGDAQDFIGKSFSNLHPDAGEEYTARIRNAIDSGEPGEYEDLVRFPTGERWLFSNVHPVRDARGRIFAAQIVSQDLTERKSAEREKESLEAQLRQSQKLEAIGQLAGGVAHDFNNILTAIFGNVELSMGTLRQELKPNASLIDAMEQIERSAQRASTLTRQLLAFSRRQISQPEVLSVNQILADLDKMLRRLVTENITLEIAMSPELHTVRADSGQLEQVIVNLVVNAADAMPDGGRLTLETQSVTLDEGYVTTHAEAQSGPHVALIVSDTGHGMDAETRERIFEPFFTTKTRERGTGLGLATVHGIVKQSGGHITVYSEPGRGTTFKVYLPVVAGQAALSAGDSAPAPTQGGSETLLLCEDDHAVRELTARVLAAAGYTVLAAAGGKEALKLAAAHEGPLDLLITDVIIPDLNGRQLSDTLQGQRPGLPTLFISGYTSNVIAHHGVLNEGVEFLEKPFTRNRLLARVREVLQRAAKRRIGK